MSQFKNFRVSVNLSNFFSDHRHRARIFVTEDIKTIEELQNRIARIFNLSNFYLTSSLNEYLPPCEDVRILQNDETLWVTPNKTDQSCHATSFVLHQGPMTGNVSQITTADERTILLSEEPCNNLEDVKKYSKKKKASHDKSDNICQYPHEERKHSFQQDESSHVKLKRSSAEATGDLEDLEIAQRKKKVKRDKYNEDCDLQSKSDRGSISHKTNADMELNADGSMSMDDVEFVPKKKKRKSDKSNGKGVLQKAEKLKNHRLDADLGNCNYNIETSRAGKDTFDENSCSNAPEASLTRVFDQDNQNQGEICENNVQTHLVPNNVTSEKQRKKDKLLNNTKDDMVCKGDLNNYKKKLDIKSNTEEYLKKKKINIVQIEIVHNANVVNGSSNESNNKEQSVNVSSFATTKFEGADKRSLIKNTTPIEFAPDTIDMQNDSELPKPPCNELKAMLKKFRENRKKHSRIFRTPERFKIIKENSALPKIGHIENNAKESQADDILQSQVTNMDQEQIVNDNVENVFVDIPNKEVNIRQNSMLTDVENNENNKVPDCPTMDINPETKDKLDDSGLVSIELSQNIQEGGNIEEIQENCNKRRNGPEIIIENVEQSFGNLEEERKHSQSVMNTSTDISPIYPSSNICEASFNWSTVSSVDSSVEVKQVNTSVISGLQWLSGTSKHFRSKMVSGVGDMLHHLRENTSTISSRSSCVSEGDANTSEHIEILNNSNCKVENVSIDEPDAHNATHILDDQNDELECSNRRRRKRHRKRKTDRISVIELSPAPNNLPLPLPMKTKSPKQGPSMHIKFVENPDDSSIMVVDLSSREISQSDIQSITVDSDTEEIEIKLENIMKSPLMDGLLPKCGDIISFKILKMSDCYNPEVSPYITAKVKNFSNETKITTLEIINGLAHFEVPSGKLKVESNEERFLSNIRDVCWSELIEPRLLYP